MLLFVGLGNPGPEHAGNRHNIGFMAADAIVRRHSFGAWRSRFHGLVAEGKLGHRKVLVLKPQTYMNESGRSAGEAMRFHKLKLSAMVVFHDELDLVPGKLRVKTGGGNAGHKGLRSLDAHLGKDYRRVRLGIGHPGDKARVTGHVLRDFAKADKAWLTPFLDALAEAAPLLAKGDDGAFMSKIAHLAREADPRPKRERARAPEATPPANGVQEDAAPAKSSALRAAFATAFRRLAGKRNGDGI